MTIVGQIAEEEKYKVLEKNAIEMLKDGIGIDKVAIYTSLLVCLLSG